MAHPSPTIARRDISLRESAPDELERERCRVGGTNQNYTSAAGTLYHIQVEDLGPVVDRVTESEVRRVNVIVYANYGEPNARIIHGRDYDFPDVRTAEQNEAIKAGIPVVVANARAVIEDKEKKQVARIKALIREYHRSRDESAKKAFEEANGLFPFLFSRAWMELKREKDGVPAEQASPDEVLSYPLEAGLRERVIDIERLIQSIAEDVQALQASGQADDILIQTCRKLTLRAREALAGRQADEFTARHLDMIRSSLTTTWRQLRGRLK